MKLTMIKMKFKIFICLAFIAAGIVFNSCSTAEYEGGKHDMVDVENLNFILTEATFGEDKQLTRAIEAPVKQTVNLGDDLTAEISVERDKNQELVTRATTPLSDGTYFIYAVGSDGRRIKGANSLLKGQVTAGVFKADKNIRLRLSPGEYTFVCYNQYVHDDGNKITITDDERARVGTTTQRITASPARQEVAFAMKRQVARVRFKITAYTEVAPDVEAKLVSTADQPTSVSYTDVISNPQTVTSAAIDKTIDFPATSSIKNILAHDFFTSYAYCMAGTNGADLKLSFSGGTIYQKNLAGKEFVLHNLGQLVGNGSYTVRIKLMTNPLYLYQDGTIAIYEERGTRTPIGVMITEKTKENAGPEEEGAGMAMALKDASYTNSDGTTYKEFEMRAKDYWYLANNVNAEMYGDNINASKFIYNDFRGYYYNWNPEALSDYFKTTYPNTPQVEIPIEPTDPPHAFGAAGHYNPGVIQTGSALSKWFLPTVAEMILALRKLKIVDVQLSDFGPGGSSPYYWNTRINDLAFSKNVFTKVGGDVLFTNDYTQVWTSSDSDGNLYHYTVVVSDDETYTYKILESNIQRNYNSCRVRPFIYF